MNPLLERDDVVAAMFAAEVNRGLKYVDKQTTNRPSAQPPASRLNPQAMVEKKNTPAVNRQINNIENPSNSLTPQALSDLLIPMPAGVTIPKPEATQTPTQPDAEQLQLPLNIVENKKPENAQQWFEHIDKKITEFEINIEMKFNRVYRILEDLKPKKRRSNGSI